MLRLFSLIWYRSGPLGSFVIFRANLSQAFVLFVHIYPLRFICIPLHISAHSYLRHYIPNSQREVPHTLLPVVLLASSHFLRIVVVAIYVSSVLLSRYSSIYRTLRPRTTRYGPSRPPLTCRLTL